MSKEAAGENGAILGSSAYWSSINSATFLGKLMQRPSETNYHAISSEVGSRASAAVDEIYNDLQEHINSIRSIPSDHRDALAKQVQMLYDVCGMSGSFCLHSRDCIGILSLSSFYLPITFLRPTIRSTSIIAQGNPIKAALPEGISQRKTDILQDIPVMYSGSYAGILKDSLEDIGRQMQRDLSQNERANNYITDDTARILRAAVSELERCGVSTGISDSSIERLAWFVGGDPAKIRQLQNKLNELHIGTRLTEDGVYGKNTLQAWLTFLNNLEHGTVPTLCWTDLLQTAQTGIKIGSTKSGAKEGLKNAFMLGKHPYIHFDLPHGGGNGFFRGVSKPIDYNHVNIDPVPDSNMLYEYLRKQFNHYPLTDDTYNLLKDLEATGKKVKIAGKVLLVAGVALDALELGMAVNADLKDADRKLGKTTVSTAVSIGGRWVGAAAGAKAGAVLGAMAGPAAPIAIPVLSIVGGIGGSFAGNYLAKWVVDITYVED